MSSQDSILLAGAPSFKVVSEPGLRGLALGPQGRLVPKEERPPVPPEKTEDLQEVNARPQRLAPDVRREVAQRAAKARWASWAGKKLAESGK
jgi:hypothetical protein